MADTVSAFSAEGRAGLGLAQRVCGLQTRQHYRVRIAAFRSYPATTIAGFSPRASASFTSVTMVRLSPGISAT